MVKLSLLWEKERRTLISMLVRIMTSLREASSRKCISTMRVLNGSAIKSSLARRSKRKRLYRRIHSISETLNGYQSVLRTTAMFYNRVRGTWSQEIRENSKRPKKRSRKISKLITKTTQKFRPCLTNMKEMWMFWAEILQRNKLTLCSYINKNKWKTASTTESSWRIWRQTTMAKPDSLLLESTIKIWHLYRNGRIEIRSPFTIENINE